VTFRRLLLFATILAWSCGPTPSIGDHRGAYPLLEKRADRSFAPDDSAGLFVGIRSFIDDNLADVEFAVDDAVDLAYAFCIEEKTKRIPPERAVLAIVGAPEKPDSKRRLQELKDAGIRIIAPTQKNILNALRERAAAAGSRGLLVVTLATHGFSSQGVPYLVSSSSYFQHLDTSISVSRMLDVASATGAKRSLFLVDACRERLKNDPRAVQPDDASKSLFMKKMNRTTGQAVLWAAAAGGYAYDDKDRRNGVFTYWVLQGLQGKAATDSEGFVTFDTLAQYVDREVTNWITTNRKLDVFASTQISAESTARNMPLVYYGTSTAGPPPPLPKPQNVAASDETFCVFDETGKELWENKVAGKIIKSEVADLDHDGFNEVIVGDDSGCLTAFKANGVELWKQHTPYPVTKLLIARLARTGKQKQVAAISSNGSQSQLSVVDAKGKMSICPYNGDLREIGLLTNMQKWTRLVLIGELQHSSIRGIEGAVPNIQLLHPFSGKLAACWSGIVSQTIDRVETRDCNDDMRPDVLIRTNSGSSVCVDVAGGTVARNGSVRFERIASK